MTPTADQLGGILRAFIPGATALATYYGLGTGAQDTVIATGAVTLIVSIWSAYTNRPSKVIP